MNWPPYWQSNWVFKTPLEEISANGNKSCQIAAESKKNALQTGTVINRSLLDAADAQLSVNYNFLFPNWILCNLPLADKPLESNKSFRFDRRICFSLDHKHLKWNWMKLAFDKLNQHQIIIHRKKPNWFLAELQTLRFYLLPSTLYGDGVEDELWIKLNKYLIAIFCNVFSLP